jgi:LDH2 family malate/lactate/ureidoglycolate dehydrogenase
VGGDLGYKGYGLSFMGEVFSGILTTLGFGLDPQGKHNDGSFIAAWRIDAFADLDWFKQQVTDFIKFIKTSPLSAGSKGIMYPGELEKDMEAKLRKEGIAVEDSVWSDITGLIQEYELQGVVGAP